MKDGFVVKIFIECHNYCTRDPNQVYNQHPENDMNRVFGLYKMKYQLDNLQKMIKPEVIS